MSESVHAQPTPTRRPHNGQVAKLLGPAFVAAVAYVDPGNVAANITAGARYGYVLVWVLVLSNLSAMIVQYLSAKLGIVTGRSLPQILGERLGKPARIAYWVQAEIVAAATDLAEVIGGALALNLLFGVPLFAGGLILGLVSLAMLNLQSRRGQVIFERVIMGLLLVITIGFLAGLVLAPPDWGGVGSGMIPHFAGTDSVLVAASMLGATVMPHAIYLHSSLVNDRHGTEGLRTTSRAQLLHASRWDIIWALSIAGLVNIGLLLLAASALSGVPNTDTIQGAHHAIANTLGPAIGVIFAIGLLASGLASTSVGAYAGSEIMRGLLHIKVSLLGRRLITLVPALVILGVGAEPTAALVISQVVLSFGIPLAVIPLMRFTSSTHLMGDFVNTRTEMLIGGVVSLAIVALNVLLVVLTVTGHS